MQYNREFLKNSVIECIKDIGFVNAAWEVGAVAFDRVDQYSDVDLMIDCEDDRIEDLFSVIENNLKKIDSIEFLYRMPYPPSADYQQKFYKLKNFSKFCTLDLAILRNSASDKLLEKEIHNNITVFFDKKGITNVKPLDKEEFIEKIDKTVTDLEKRVQMFHQIVEKEFYRNNPMEAAYGYYSLILNPLITMIRLYFNPFHYNFRQRYLHYELDKATAGKLENLFFIKDMEDLREKYSVALKWFGHLIENYNKEKIYAIIGVKK